MPVPACLPSPEPSEAVTGLVNTQETHRGMEKEKFLNGSGFGGGDGFGGGAVVRREEEMPGRQ